MFTWLMSRRETKSVQCCPQSHTQLAIYFGNVMHTHFSMLFALSWAFFQPVDCPSSPYLQNLVLLLLPSQAFLSSGYTSKAEYLRYLCWNIKLKKVIFLSKSDCHLINIDFFFSLSGDFTTSWIPEEINIQCSSMSHLYSKSRGPSRSHFKSISSSVWSASVPFRSRKMGVSCFSKKKQVPASPGYHFLSFFPYYYMCKLAVLIFACCQQCFALLMEAIYPKRKFDAKNWKGAKW